MTLEEYIERLKRQKAELDDMHGKCSTPPLARLSLSEKSDFYQAVLYSLVEHVLPTVVAEREKLKAEAAGRQA